MAELMRTQHLNGLAAHYFVDGEPVDYETFGGHLDRAAYLSCFSTVSFRDRLGDEAYKHYCTAR